MFLVTMMGLVIVHTLRGIGGVHRSFLRLLIWVFARKSTTVSIVIKSKQQCNTLGMGSCLNVEYNLSQITEIRKAASRKGGQRKCLVYSPNRGLWPAQKALRQQDWCTSLTEHSTSDDKAVWSHVTVHAVKR